MASNEPTKKRKRLTMEDVNITAPVYDPPKQFTASGLYDPSFVVVDVVDENHPSWTQKFTLPLDLLSARSPYFKSLFEGGFAEVFVGWLYYQHIFYDVEKKTAREFTGRPVPSAPKSKAANLKANSDAKRNDGGNDSDGDEEDAQQPVINLTGEEATESCTHPNTDEKTSTGEASKHATKKAPAKRGARQPKPTRHHPPGGNDKKYKQEEEVTYGEQQNSPDECNYREPTTWPCEWLCNLYLFADKYDIRDFRMSVFEVIQMKFFQLEPRRYSLPHNTILINVVESLPPQSPLYRLLADCWGHWLGLPGLRSDAESQAQYYEKFPAHFLARCLIVARRSEKALLCAKCKPGGSGQICDAGDHSKEDQHVPSRKDRCYYHEHGEDDEEKARCTLRWESRRHQF